VHVTRWRLLEPVPHHSVEKFVHVAWWFLRSAVEPPSQQRQQAPGQCKGARSQFTLRNLRKTLGFSEAMLDAARKVALREIEEIVETACVGKDAIKLPLVLDMRKHLRHGDNSMRHFFANGERRAHRLQELFQLAEEQVVLVAEVKIKGRAADRGAVQHILPAAAAELKSSWSFMEAPSSGARLIIVCGLPGSGKTTHAKQLQASLRAIRLCPDEWMNALSVDIWDERRREKIEGLQWQLAQQLFALGFTVIIEWGTWVRSERDTLRLRARELGASAELHYLPAPVDVLLDRLQHRGMENPPIKREQLLQWVNAFQAPTAEELTLFDRVLTLEAPAPLNE
jgi:predicted kinase